MIQTLSTLPVSPPPHYHIPSSFNLIGRISHNKCSAGGLRQMLFSQSLSTYLYKLHNRVTLWNLRPVIFNMFPHISLHLRGYSEVGSPLGLGLAKYSHGQERGGMCTLKQRSHVQGGGGSVLVFKNCFTKRSHERCFYHFFVFNKCSR